MTVAASIPASLTGLADIARIVSANLNAGGVNDDIAFIQQAPTLRVGTMTNNGVLGYNNPDVINNPFPLVGPAFSPLAIALAPFDGDANVDLVVTHTTAGADALASVYINDGTGDVSGGRVVATSPLNLTTSNPVAVATGDVSGDANIDVLAANNTSTNVAIATNDAVPNGAIFGPVTRAIGAGPVSIVVGDFDGTGATFSDFAVVDGTNIEVHLNAAGAFAAGVLIAVPNTPEVLALADMDGINGVDLIVGSTAAPEVRVYLNNGAGTFTIAAQGTITVAGLVGLNILDIEVGNFDGAGNADIAVLLDTNEVAFLINNQGGNPAQFTQSTVNGGPATTVPLSPGSGATDMTVMNHDGGQDFDDIAVAEPTLGQVEMLRMS